MASALPIILAAGAAAVILGKKKKKKAAPEYEEPDIAPGEGYEDVDEMVGVKITGWAVTPEAQLTVAKMAYPKNIDPKKLGDKANEDQEKDEKKNPPKKPKKRKCKTGTLSADKKWVCWGDRFGAFTASIPQRRKMRRVAKYKTARRAAAAVALTGGLVASPAMRIPKTRFLLYCWLNRKKLYHRKCVKRFKRGKKRCRRFKTRRY